MKKMVYYFNITYRCINNCIFCIADSGQQHDDIGLEQFKKIVEEENIRDAEIILSGGEPTILPHFLEILDKANSTGSNIILMTNGRTLANEDYAFELLKNENLREIQIPVHGTKNIHEQITRVKGSFEETMEGIENLIKFKRENQKITVKIALSKLNYQQLPEVVQYVSERFPKINQFVFSSLKISEKCLREREKIIFPMNHVVPYLSDTLRYMETKNINVELDYLPPCIIGAENYELALKLKEKREHTYTGFEQVYYDGETLKDPDKRIVMEENISGYLLKECVVCKYHSCCRGIDKSYAKLISTKDIDPVRYVDERLEGYA